MNKIIGTYNPTVRFLKFTLNMRIYEECEGFFQKVVWKETLFLHGFNNSSIFCQPLLVSLIKITSLCECI